MIMAKSIPFYTKLFHDTACDRKISFQNNDLWYNSNTFKENELIVDVETIMPCFIP